MLHKFIITLRLTVLLLAVAALPALAEEAKAEAAAPAEAPTMLMVANFEGEDFTNLIGGESGEWNLDPTDINNSYTDLDLVDMEDAEGRPNRALRLSYSVDSDVPSQNGYWTKLMDLDATDYDQLVFDVKGDSEKGFTTRFKVELKKFKDEKRIEKIKGSYEIPVTPEWQTVRIPLNRMTGIIDFSDPKVWENPAIARRDLDEFVVVFQDRYVTRKKGTVYLDNIRFVHTGHPGPTAVDFPPRKKEKTETRIEGLDFARFLVKRLGGFPERVHVHKEFPEEPEAFLKEIARDTWRFFDEIVDQEHQLPLDTIQLGENEPLEEGSWIGDYTNVTNIGVYLMCVVSAYDLGFISRQEAIDRLRATMTTMESVEYHESGFPYNYYDTTTLERTSYFVSLVDSGWLVAGLYVVKNAFPEELSEQAMRLIGRGNFKFFYDPVERQMYHGYYEHLQVYSDYRYGVFYTEPRVTSYIAIARGEVPVEHWFEGMIRTFPKEFGWQTQTPIDRVKRTTLGHTYYGGYYEWKGIRYVPSWGGSSFEALMPTLVLKERELAPAGLGMNDLAHVQGQIRYALEEKGYDVWGMSPSSVPEGGYSEYGAQPFGSKGYKAGVVTPHASVLALDYAPEAVIENLRRLLRTYDIYGEYGFYDAVTVATGKVARKYLALDQAMILVSINNYLNDGAIRKRFHADPVLKSVENLLTEEVFFPEPQPAEDAEPAAA